MLISCEGGTTYTKTISNKSNDTLTILIFSQWEYMEDSIVLLPDKTETIFFSDKLGGDETPIICTAEFDSINVLIPDNKVLKKDILDNSNWDFHLNSKKNGRFVNQYCEFEIQSDDIE